MELKLTEIECPQYKHVLLHERLRWKILDAVSSATQMQFRKHGTLYSVRHGDFVTLFTEN